MIAGMREEPPSKSYPHGRIYVTAAIAVGEGGYTVVCGVGEAPYSDTPEKALEAVRRPLNVAVGLVSGWVPKLSPRELWELRTPACDKRHKTNPFGDRG